MTNLQVVTWPVEKLIPYARNARTHSKKQIRQIADSIERFGFVNPVLVDNGGRIVAGHGRVARPKLNLRPTVPLSTVLPTRLTSAMNAAINA